MLLPTIILYHFRKEPQKGKKLLNCFKYGMLFIVVMILEYIPYFSDMNVLSAMTPQLDRYSKSIYAVLAIVNVDLMFILRCINSIAFIYIFMCFCFQILLKEKNTIFDMLRKYNTIVVLSLLVLTNCQQWYLSWLFATIMWQKSKTIRDIIGLTAIVEIANSIYMFKTECYIYDIYFVGIIICLFMIWQASGRNKNKKAINNYTKV